MGEEEETETMKTEQEVRRAISHVQEAVIAAPNPEAVAMCLRMVDLLNWVLGNPSQFEFMVMQPCDDIDRRRNN